MGISTKYYEAVGLPKSIVDGCNSFVDYYDRTNIHQYDSVTTKIKKIAIIVFLYIPAKATSFLSHQITRRFSAPIPHQVYEKKKEEYLQLFDFGFIDDPEDHIDKLIAKNLPNLDFRKIYVIELHANRSNRLFAYDGQRAQDLPTFESLRDKKEKVLFCFLNRTELTIKDFWESHLISAGGSVIDEKTGDWLRERCVNVMDDHSWDSLYEKIRNASNTPLGQEL